MLELTTFTREHIPQARTLALSCYIEERVSVPILPEMDGVPPLECFADNALGVSALRDGVLVGFLCCYNPIDNFFGTTKGTFSPIHAHGAIRKDRAKLYSLLYAAAADKWVRAGVLSHAIALYSHDREGMDSFFRNGFGARCVDAIRPAVPLGVVRMEGCAFRELSCGELETVLPMKNGLIDHLCASPVYIPLSRISLAELEAEQRERSSRFFLAERKGCPAAFVEIQSSGENFACEGQDMMNVCGAYMYPEHRGRGLYAGLLDHLLSVLQDEGYKRLGVDYESINPTARGFWEKYFTPYTYSLTRRIDERVYRG